MARIRLQSCTGSPPRVWGQLPQTAARAHIPRFTPTCVGTTCPKSLCSAYRSVHPHVCGDNSLRIALPSIFLGSPPRVWGQLEIVGRIMGIVRFTPTCVGTTPEVARQWIDQSVHPHVCGDNVGAGVDGPLANGSPPRVWGQPDCAQRRRERGRFTPTCVGTTPSRSINWPRATVHPHVCGDNDHRTPFECRVFGSPPRVWGQHRAYRQTR